MSTMLRVKSSVLAPSLTTIASGRALTASRMTASALWKFIGDGFSASVAAIFDRFLSLRSAIAPVQSAGALAQFESMPPSSADTQDPMSPISGAAMATLLSISVGAMSIWMNCFGPPQVLPLPCDNNQFSRAPTSITTSASAST